MDNNSVTQQPSSIFVPIIDNSIPGLEKIAELRKVTVKVHPPNPFHCENFEYILVLTLQLYTEILITKVDSLSFFHL